MAKLNIMEPYNLYMKPDDPGSKVLVAKVGM